MRNEAPSPPAFNSGAIASGHGQAFVNNGNIGTVEQHQTPSPPLAEYRFYPYRIHASLDPLRRPTLQMRYVGAIAAGLGVIADSLSLADRFGFSPWLPGMFVVAGGFVALIAWWRLRIVDQLQDYETVQHGDVIYRREQDGRISENSAQADCPVPGCPGRLLVQRLPPNEEGYRLGGTCSERRQHVFDFHLHTRQGAPISPTPLRTTSA